MNSLFNAVSVGGNTLSSRVAMAPMTRSRAKPDGVPGDLSAEYYGQRAGVGLVITEGAQPSEDGQGYLATPGIYTDAHVAGWKPTIEAVHGCGARIIIQLMHAGRMSHPDNTPHHRRPVAPSAIAPGTGMFTATGMQDIPVPRVLTADEIGQTIADFRHAARSRRARTGSRSMGRMLISSISSSRRAPIRVPTTMAARSRIALASPLR